MSCQIKENQLFMNCQMQETTIAKLIKTTEKTENNNHAYVYNHELFKVMHSLQMLSHVHVSRNEVRTVHNNT